MDRTVSSIPSGIRSHRAISSGGRGCGASGCAGWERPCASYAVTLGSTLTLDGKDCLGIGSTGVVPVAHAVIRDLLRGRGDERMSTIRNETGDRSDAVLIAADRYERLEAMELTLGINADGTPRHGVRFYVDTPASRAAHETINSALSHRVVGVFANGEQYGIGLGPFRWTREEALGIGQQIIATAGTLGEPASH